MNRLISFILTSLLLCQNIHCVSTFLQSAIVAEPVGPPSATKKCPNNLATTCNLQCVDGNYALDEEGCPTCVCAADQSVKRIGRPPKSCPLVKCRVNCGDAGYKIDENGCQTCECLPKSAVVECPPAMCRMYCVHGFRRDENGCEICQCNDSPQPCPALSCPKICSKGYRKDYSGCQTCSCKDEEPKQIISTGCSPMKCNLDCPYGFERDPSGCELCSCNRCSLFSCRMFCMYGFKKNSDGCDVCECDWAPISEKIQCSERVPCQDNRVCNLNLKLCELVGAEKVNWFVYNFDIKTNLFENKQFVETFKRDLINNIAMKYDLETTQITVSSVESGGMTSFQIMPFYVENLDDFQQKIDQIDIDLNTHEFRLVLPGVVRAIERQPSKLNESGWKHYMQRNPRFVLYLVAFLLGCVGLIFTGVLIFLLRHRVKHPKRSESKSPIYDTSYHQAPTEDEHYHAVHAPDGTAYVVVESEDIQSSNDKRALV